MATIAYGLLSSLNNALCDPGVKGAITLPFMPILFGGLNIVIIILIVLTAVLIRYTGGNNFQNYDGTNRKFSRSFMFALLWWYIGLFAIFLLYKLFGCSRTVGRTKAYSELQNLSGKGGKGGLVDQVFQVLGKN